MDKETVQAVKVSPEQSLALDLISTNPIIRWKSGTNEAASIPAPAHPADPGLATWTTAPGTQVLPAPSSALRSKANLRTTQEQNEAALVVKSPDTWILAPPRASSHFSL